MRKVLLCLAAIGCVAVFSAVANAQCGVLGGECLINGNLDIGTAATATDPGSAPPWTLTNVNHVSAAQYQHGFSDSTIPGDTAADGRGIWYRSFLGGGTSMAPLVSADLSQSAVATMTGLYQLTFDYLVEINHTTQSTMATLSSTSGGTSSLDLLTVPRTSIGGGFAAQPADVGTLFINATAGDTLTVHLAMVDGQTSGIPGGQSLVADRFSLVKVPEPASAMLGLIGVLGLVGLTRRR